MDRNPMSLAQSLHEELRLQGVAAVDEPWNLCPAEYRFHMIDAARNIVFALRREPLEDPQRDSRRKGLDDGFAEGVRQRREEDDDKEN